MAELGLENVLPFDRPMSAGKNDRFVGFDEFGQKIYETPLKQRYTIRPATKEESQTTRAKVEDWIEEGAPLPSKEQVVEAIKDLPAAMYDSAANAVRGTGTVGDVIGMASASAAPGVGRLLDPYDPTITRMFFGPDSPKADLNLLTQAEKLKDNGFSEADIWEITGWWEGPNGWKFEIPDDQAEFTPDVKSQFGSKVVKKPTTDVINHQEFFDALPIQHPLDKNYINNSESRVAMLPNLGVNEGEFHPGSAYIQAIGKSEDELKSVFLHELQHFVQQLENSPSKGANPSDIYQRIDKTFSSLPLEAKEYLAVVKSHHNTLLGYEALREQAPRYKGDWATNQEDRFRNNDPTIYKEDYDEAIEKLRLQTEADDAIYESQLSPSFIQALQDFYEFTDGFQGSMEQTKYGVTKRKLKEYADDLNDLAFNLYQRNPGEIEARLTAARAELTPEQRKRTVPSLDLDEAGKRPLEASDIFNRLNTLEIETDAFSNGGYYPSITKEDWTKKMSAAAMGGTYKPPRYKTLNTESIDPLEQQPFDPDLFNIRFDNSLDQILSELEVPSQGLKGSQLLKDLKDNPAVGNAYLKSIEAENLIDPQKRYTKSEIDELFGDKGFEVKATPENNFSNYQRQNDLVDAETDYVEYTIDAKNRSQQSPFDATSQHYNPETLAHVRLSERSSDSGKYILIEELQSDLLQKGWHENSPIPWQDRATTFLDKRIPKAREEGLLPRGMEEIPRAIKEEDVYADFQGRVDVIELIDKILDRVGFDRENSVARNVVVRFLYNLGQFVPPNRPNVSTPPVAKTEESVRLGIETAIAHAHKRGLTKVVIPPFEKIVEKRFSDREGREKALSPKSGFYATYVEGVKKTLRGFQDEFGDKIRVTSRKMEYDPNAKENSFDDWEPEPDLIDVDFVPEWAPTTPEEMYFSYNFRDSYQRNLREANATEFGIPNNFDRKILQTIDEIGEKIKKRDEEGGFDATELTPAEMRMFQVFKFTIQDLHPGRVSGSDLINRMIDNNVSLSQAGFDLIFAKKPKPQIEVKQGIEIDFSSLINEGYDLSRPRFAEGGMVENQPIDPVSKNPIPLGANAKEVRDDVTIQASEGEYVIPANVVRYLGLDKIEKLVEQAKKGLAELNAKGRIGGKTEEDLPFDVSELQAVENTTQAPKMAEGGVVQAPSTLPPWLTNLQTSFAPPAPQTPTPAPMRPISSQPRHESTYKEPTGIAGSVDKWTTDDFNKYSKARTDVGQRIGQGIASMVPFGGLAVKHRQNYLERTVPEKLTEMIKEGKDLQGKPLSTDQLNQLKETYNTITSNPIGKATGFRALAKETAQKTGLIKKREDKTETAKTPTKKESGLVSRPSSKSEQKKDEKREERSSVHKSTDKKSTTEKPKSGGFFRGGR